MKKAANAPKAVRPQSIIEVVSKYDLVSHRIANSRIMGVNCKSELLALIISRRTKRHFLVSAATEALHKLVSNNLSNNLYVRLRVTKRVARHECAFLVLMKRVDLNECLAACPPCADQIPRRISLNEKNNI
jgi:hypothetical protein